MLPDALAAALAEIISECEREWRREIERIAAESRATIAELKTQVLTSEAALHAAQANDRKRIDDALATVVNGSPGHPGKDGRDGADGKDGESITADDIAPMISMIIADELAKIPAPKDGRDGQDGRDGADGKEGVTIDDIAPMISAVIADELAKIPPPKDGRDGQPGRDGAPGRDGKDGERGPPGVDGKNGRDGVDGAGFDSWAVEYDNERAITIKCGSGEREKQFQLMLPLVIDRGVYKAGSAYQKGDGVTYAGSFFIAQYDTSEKPETSDWRLAIKRGRDGKDGKDGASGAAGPEGKPGRDLTQIGPDGRKW